MNKSKIIIFLISSTECENFPNSKSNLANGGRMPTSPVNTSLNLFHTIPNLIENLFQTFEEIIRTSNPFKTVPYVCKTFLNSVNTLEHLFRLVMDSSVQLTFFKTLPDLCMILCEAFLNSLKLFLLIQPFELFQVFKSLKDFVILLNLG